MQTLYAMREHEFAAQHIDLTVVAAAAAAAAAALSLPRSCLTSLICMQLCSTIASAARSHSKPVKVMQKRRENPWHCEPIIHISDSAFSACL